MHLHELELVVSGLDTLFVPEVRQTVQPGYEASVHYEQE